MRRLHSTVALASAFFVGCAFGATLIGLALSGNTLAQAIIIAFVLSSIIVVVSHRERM